MAPGLIESLTMLIYQKVLKQEKPERRTHQEWIPKYDEMPDEKLQEMETAVFNELVGKRDTRQMSWACQKALKEVQKKAQAGGTLEDQIAVANAVVQKEA